MPQKQKKNYDMRKNVNERYVNLSKSVTNTVTFIHLFYFIIFSLFPLLYICLGYHHLAYITRSEEISVCIMHQIHNQTRKQ